MDWTLFQHVNDFQQRTGWAHGVMRDYAKYGVVIFAGFLLVAGLMSLRQTPRALARTLWAAGAALVALALNQPIANAVDRARPYTNHPNVHVLIAKGTDPSFMSDHSLIAGAVAAGLCFVSLRLGIVAGVAALFMAFARVYVGAHYPGDVLAGLAFGAVIAAIGVPLADRALAPIIERITATSIGRRFVTYESI
ncbi:MAG TPA: phosphatase PAP2 family protein [Acidimicrobiia bacterium]|jgi:undecaprenyl-diphosphatase|nr:phosphatase PAP2 family protein [Acidimicrobiia bacterium]